MSLPRLKDTARTLWVLGYGACLPSSYCKVACPWCDPLQEGRSASAVAHAEGHAEMAELLMCQTGRPHTRTNTSASQPSETPSAPPWAPAQATLHQPAPPQPTTPHASTLHHLGAPPQLARSASARPSSTAAGSGAAVAYPAVYPLSSLFSQQPSAEAIAETVGVSRPAAQPGHSGGSHGLQAQTVQVEAPRMGYVPAAVSFMMGKLQVHCLLSWLIEPSLLTNNHLISQASPYATLYRGCICLLELVCA